MNENSRSPEIYRLAELCLSNKICVNCIFVLWAFKTCILALLFEIDQPGQILFKCVHRLQPFGILLHVLGSVSVYLMPHGVKSRNFIRR